MKQTDTLIAAREAQGLQLVVGVRLAYVMAFAPGDLAFVHSVGDFLVWLAILVAFVGVSAFFIHQLRRRRGVDVIGIVGALLDVLIVAVGAVVWSRVTGAPQALWVQASLLPMGAMLTIVINGLALRPRYPIVVTLGIAAIIAVSLALGLRDPHTAVSARFLEVAPRPGELSVGLAVGAMLMALATGAVTVILTVLSRRTVREAVQLERLNTALAESQAEVVIEQKIAALTQLAAGVSHELNTPLGAMSSTAATTSRLAAKVRALLEQRGEALAESPELGRALASLEQSAAVAQQAGERISRVAGTLRQFIRLDQSERETVQLPDVIEETLGLLGHQLGKRIAVETRYGELPPITCYPRRLNQVFYTIVRNAAESIEGQGTIAISARATGEAIELRIADSGRGIPPEQLETLFDVRFSPDRARVHAAMGLPICRSVIRRHGGRIAVGSAVGRGTTFTITLPLAPPETGGADAGGGGSEATAAALDR